MPRSNAATVDEYLDALPEEKREVMTTMVDLIRRNVPKGYQESIAFGQIAYAVPLEKYPKTYNGQPLMYLALAAQKNYYALYLLGPYGDPKQREALAL